MENLKNKKLIIVLIMIANFLIFTSSWAKITFEGITFDQIVFHSKVSVKGANISFFLKYIKNCFLYIFIITIIECLMLLKDYKKINFFNKLKEKKRNKIIKVLAIIQKYNLRIAIVYFLICLIFVERQLKISNYIKSQIQKSVFIEENYVEPVNEKIIFDSQKQNLIYIILESMENTYSSLEFGGGFKENLMPELTQIAKENINFSNTEKLGGATPIAYTGWTIASMVAQTTGVPLKIAIEGNSYGKYSSFLPGIVAMGEILENNGYKNYLMLGSDSAFGGRKKFYEQHGNYEIWDFESAIKEGKMTRNERVWWGFDDNNLFKYAKEKLIDISKQEKPFNFTMLTVDTHHIDGYVCEKCEVNYNEKYSNVIACSSKQVSEFVKWIQKQDFYENTTIVLCGDHLTMEPNSYFEKMNLDGQYVRTTYNAIINSKIEPQKEKNRVFSTLDMFPTTLASIGAKIEGDRLGLGTNLFSELQTIYEKYGVEYVNSELIKTSVFYNKKFIENAE